MSVISSRYYSLSKQPTGYRVRFEFTFDDGRIVTRGPVWVVDETDAGVKLLNMIADVETSIASDDSERVVHDEGDITDSGYATKRQIARSYFESAMAKTEIVPAYKELKKVIDYITAQGWTGPQVKSQLNLSDRQWTAIQLRYNYFKTNKSAIENFMALDDPLGDL